MFYLEVDELIGFAEGTATTSNLRGLADVRRQEFDGYRTTPPPAADRFTTRGGVHVHNVFEAPQLGEAEKAGGVLHGLGCGSRRGARARPALSAIRTALRWTGTKSS